ncbi:DUF2963 domain-containing protein [Candidatus Phytoplasma asteris]|uniref:DUF2963 domain-containing protein n=2 Tax=16SrI (Aster yellows group) TaxID=3042590 RepID=A0A859I960_9MOLU|nr:MAG: hypothetical protein RP166_1820 [Rapeseed phyllody phytoplasma]QKX95186.1 MAG: hypothetical protein RP166_1850 [Rapeseed phyllody phytoplasma]QKX95212.1 MAG: hypothetical protein RP166_2140 [Rapeseed phyllody phytoplasma]
MKTIIKEFIDDYGIKVVQEFDKITGHIIKATYYKDDEKIIYYRSDKTIDCIIESVKNTSFTFQEVFYQADGKTIDYIESYERDIDKLIKETYYKSDGKTIDYIKEYDGEDSARILLKKTYYYDDGTIKKIINFWNQ